MADAVSLGETTFDGGFRRVTEGPAGYVVVGKPVDAATRAQIAEVGADELAVWVPPDVIDRMKGA